jgi:hypothetical protein
MRCSGAGFCKSHRTPLIQQLGEPPLRTFIINPGDSMRLQSPGFIGDPEFNDQRKIDAFTAYQAFFMGITMAFSCLTPWLIPTL